MYWIKKVSKKYKVKKDLYTKNDNDKLFIIFASNFIGDTLILNGLVQNIKENFYDAKVVFVVPKYLYPIAKYQYQVDDVIIFDNKKKNNLSYIVSFILNFKYKHPYCSFSINAKERDLLIAKLIGSRNIYTSKINKISRFFANWDNNQRNSYKSMAENYSAFIEPLIKKEIKQKPIIFVPPNIASDNIKTINRIKQTNKIITIVPANSYKQSSKNMPIDDFSALIDNISKEYTILLVGKGDYYDKYINVLTNKNINFANFINKLDLLEVTSVFKKSDIIISIDTGLMHLSYAMGCKTIALFYENSLKDLWAPDERIYNNVVVLSDDISPDLIFKSIKDLTV